MSRALLVLGFVAAAVPVMALVGCRKKQSCQAVETTAESAFQSAHHARPDCRVDDDCIAVTVPRSLRECRAISRTAAPALEAAASTIDREWDDLGCTSPRRDCSRFVPRCRNNEYAHCDMEPRLSDTQCAEVIASAQATLDRVLAEAPKACRSKEDCMPVGATACHDDYCGGGSIARVDAGIGYAVGMMQVKIACSSWAQGDCRARDPSPSPSCVPFTLGCEKGRCVAFMPSPP